jgi:putative transcriptional regulator
MAAVFPVWPKITRALSKGLFVALTIHLDLMLVLRKKTSRDLAHFVGTTEQNLSLLKSAKVRGVRFATLARTVSISSAKQGTYCTLSLEKRMPLPTRLLKNAIYSADYPGGRAMSMGVRTTQSAALACIQFR